MSLSYLSDDFQYVLRSDTDTSILEDALLSFTKNAAGHNNSFADAPAFVSFNKFGVVTMKQWYSDGKLHRESGPAYIKYKQGVPLYAGWFLNGLASRADSGEPSELFFEKGQLAYRRWIGEDGKFRYGEYTSIARDNYDLHRVVSRDRDRLGTVYKKDDSSSAVSPISIL